MTGLCILWLLLCIINVKNKAFMLLSKGHRKEFIFLLRETLIKIFWKLAYPRKFMVKNFRTITNRNFNEDSYLSWVLFPYCSLFLCCLWYRRENGTQSLRMPSLQITYAAVENRLWGVILLWGREKAAQAKVI